MARPLVACLLLLLACDGTGKPDPDEPAEELAGNPDAVDEDGDGFLVSDGDCDDSEGTVNPDAIEVCDGIDNNCDGLVDEGVATTFYEDGDDDGFGDDRTARGFCEPPVGYATAGGDCDDTSAAFYPDAPEPCTEDIDYNCDGVVAYADVDADGWAECEDCDDLDPLISPDGTELCNGLDDDCDGEADPASAFDVVPFYLDSDGDSYGDSAKTTSACAAPPGYVADTTDCDDARADVNPGATELCDASDTDENCDGLADDGDPGVDPTTYSVWVADDDGDGFGLDSSAISQCDAPAGWAAIGGDCNDASTDFYPGAPEPDCDDPNDYNCDGSVAYADMDGDLWAACVDCDDTNASVNPAATELCNSLDDDCDGIIDPDTAADAGDWYADTDGDSYGDPTAYRESCASPAGYVADATDCDDTLAGINPGATESCNGLDDDCDGSVDPTTSVDALTWYADADGDSYGDPGSATAACDVPAGYTADDTDCDDTNDNVSPVGLETCNGLDDDCDGVIDPDTAFDALPWYADTDGDAYGDASASVLDCAQPRGYIADGTDCDDGRADINPGANELCDALDEDEDCDGLVDDGDPSADPTTFGTWYADGDGDGYGDPAVLSTGCEQPSGYIVDGTDCDDTRSGVHPGASENCDALDVDEDCDGLAEDDDPSVSTATYDTWYEDGDGDGYGSTVTLDACDVPSGYTGADDDCDDADASVSPAATEVCDGIDNDCDGTVDSSACTCLVDFNDAYTTYGSRANPTLYYGAYGLTFTMDSGYGLIGGDAYGDPGNWSESGSIPDPAWGGWDFGSAVNTLDFSSPVTNVAFDMARTAAGDVTVSVRSYLSGTLVTATSVSLTSASSVQTVWLTGSIDSVETTITGSSFAYAMDNLEYDGSGSCPP